jgi:hypothetical protein
MKSTGLKLMAEKSAKDMMNQLVGLSTSMGNG